MIKKPPADKLKVAKIQQQVSGDALSLWPNNLFIGGGTCEVGRVWTVEINQLDELIGALAAQMTLEQDIIKFNFKIKGTGAALLVTLKIEEIEMGFPALGALHWTFLKKDLHAFHRMMMDEETKESEITTYCLRDGVFWHWPLNPTITIN